MKTRYLKITLFTVIIMTAVLRAGAQINEPSVPDPDKKPEMVSPDKKADMPASMPAEVTNLMKFVGDWESEATFTMEGKTVKGNYWVNCKTTADGNGIFADEGFSIPEMGNMRGANLAGFDPTTSKIRWFSVDNMGTSHEHNGEWITPDHLFIEHEGTRDGKKYVEKIDFVFKGDGTLDFKLVGTLDGTEIERGEGIFHKK